MDSVAASAGVAWYCPNTVFPHGHQLAVGCVYLLAELRRHSSQSRLLCIPVIWSPLCKSSAPNISLSLLTHYLV